MCLLLSSGRVGFCREVAAWCAPVDAKMKAGSPRAPVTRPVSPEPFDPDGIRSRSPSPNPTEQPTLPAPSRAKYGGKARQSEADALRQEAKRRLLAKTMANKPRPAAKVELDLGVPRDLPPPSPDGLEVAGASDESAADAGGKGHDGLCAALHVRLVCLSACLESSCGLLHHRMLELQSWLHDMISCWLSLLVTLQAGVTFVLTHFSTVLLDFIFDAMEAGIITLLFLACIFLFPLYIAVEYLLHILSPPPLPLPYHDGAYPPQAPPPPPPPTVVATLLSTLWDYAYETPAIYFFSQFMIAFILGMFYLFLDDINQWITRLKAQRNANAYKPLQEDVEAGSQPQQHEVDVQRMKRQMRLVHIHMHIHMHNMRSTSSA